MERTYIEDQQFEKIDFTGSPLQLANYEGCTFLNCNFSNTNLSEISFAECEFKGCNLSTCKLGKTALKDVKFIECKMLGLRFEDCSNFLFEVNFDSCVLNLSTFYAMKIKKTRFKNCTLHETDFTETDLSAAIFDKCDLSRAIFANTILEKADLRTAYNYSIDPELNHLKKAKFSLTGVAGLLDKYDIELE